jgi:hypothetical protein
LIFALLRSYQFLRYGKREEFKNSIELEITTCNIY